MFNGKNFDGWTNVNCHESTWSFNDEGMLVCTGKPIGEIRTTRMYQNFVLELEWRHLKPKGNAGVFVWADDITAKGQPFIRGVEIQVLENAYGQAKWYTTHGDIFPIHGAKMTPVNGRGGMRAFPTEERSRPSPEWNHYRIECRGGDITLAVNGKVTTKGTACTPSKGYICLESEGGVVNYRNVRIAELPDTPVEAKDIAIADRGYKCLYNGVDFDGWKTSENWQSKDWFIRHKGEGSSSIETQASFQPTSVIVDFAPGEGFQRASVDMLGIQIELDPSADKRFQKAGHWHRIEGSVKDGEVIVTINNKPLEIEVAKVKPGEHSIRLTCEGSAEWANIYVQDQTE